MTAQQVLTEIYVSNEVKECVKRLKPEHLQQDILQHTFMELFERPEDFIMDLHERGKLKSYIVKILYNTATYSRSTFAKQQGKETPVDFCEAAKYDVIRASEDYKADLEYVENVKCALAEVHWYKVELLKLYADLGTYKAVSEKTGIPLTSVFMTITELRKEIKQKL